MWRVIPANCSTCPPGPTMPLFRHGTMALWQCQCGTLSLHHYVTMSLCHYATMWLVTPANCSAYISMSLCHSHYVTKSICHCVTMPHSSPPVLSRRGLLGTMPLCHYITMLLCCHSVAMSILAPGREFLDTITTSYVHYACHDYITIYPCHHVTMSLYHHVTMSPCHYRSRAGTFSTLYHYVTTSVCHYIKVSLCHYITISPCHYITMPLCHYATISP